MARETVPEAEQGTCYGMPTLMYRGKGLLAVMRTKKHIGLYPNSGRVLPEFAEQLADFDFDKGTLRPQGGEDHPVSWRVATPHDLPVEHCQLVTQHGDLHVLGIRRLAVADRAENPAEDKGMPACAPSRTRPASPTSSLVTAVLLTLHPSPVMTIKSAWPGEDEDFGTRRVGRASG